jgi:hypothetical protein
MFYKKSIFPTNLFLTFSFKLYSFSLSIFFLKVGTIKFKKFNNNFDDSVYGLKISESSEHLFSKSPRTLFLGIRCYSWHEVGNIFMLHFCSKQKYLTLEDAQVTLEDSKCETLKFYC